MRGVAVRQSMALNIIWIFLILASFAIASIRAVAFHEAHLFNDMVRSLFEMCKTSVDLSIGLVGMMAFWMGLMRVGEASGLVSILARATSPFFTALFPSLPKNHPVFGSMMMNFSANMLGLDNAATPLGLKAMKELQELNPDKDTASDAQALFLVMNTAGLTLIPIGIIAVRATMGAANPTDVFLPTLFATFIGLMAALLATSFFQRVNLTAKPVVFTLLVSVALLMGLVNYTLDLDNAQLESLTSFSGNFTILLFIVAFIGFAAFKKTNVYAEFIEGSKDGFQTAIGIIPYLVAMLVAVGLFRASGGLEFILAGLGHALAWMGLAPDILPALPTAFMKTLSGSGARAMMVETIKAYGADSLPGRLSSIFQGSSETTLYVLAVYYGSVKVRFTRHTLACSLIADVVAMLASIAAVYLFF